MTEREINHPFTYQSKYDLIEQHQEEVIPVQQHDTLKLDLKIKKFTMHTSLTFTKCQLGFIWNKLRCNLCRIFQREEISTCYLPKALAVLH